jgi:nucleotide-binding universal stress UspA family protein
MPKRLRLDAQKPFRHILCPCDFSRYSRKALQYAATLAAHTASDMTVLFVNDALLDAAGAAAYDERALKKASENELRQFVQRAIAGFHGKPLSAIKYSVTVGDPAEQIQKTVRRLRNDLVVMGTHGLTGLPRVLFGSTTEKFLRLATVPVLLIPRARR